MLGLWYQLVNFGAEQSPVSHNARNLAEAVVEQVRGNSPVHLWRDTWTALSGPLSSGATQGRACTSSSSLSVTGPRNSWSLKLRDTRVYKPQTRARLTSPPIACSWGGARRTVTHHTVKYDPFIKSRPASMQLTLGAYVVHIWSGNPRISVETNPRTLPRRGCSLKGVPDSHA